MFDTNTNNYDYSEKLQNTFHFDCASTSEQAITAIACEDSSDFTARKCNLPSLNEYTITMLLLPIIKRFVKYNIWLKQDALDFQQDAMLIILEHIRLKKIHKYEAVQSFCRGVCKNLLLQYLRDKKKYLQRYCQIESETKETISEVLPSQTNNHQNKIPSDKATQQCLILLGELKIERDKQILIEHYLYEKSPVELANKFELSEAHFYRVLHRAKTRAKQLLKSTNFDAYI